MRIKRFQQISTVCVHKLTTISTKKLLSVFANQAILDIVDRACTTHGPRDLSQLQKLLQQPDFGYINN